MKNLYQETIVAPATTPGTGAISIVRLSGPDCFRIIDAVVQLKNGTISGSKAYTIHYGEVYEPGKGLLDQVLVSVFRAPHSYTGEDSVEISTHASAYIVGKLVELLMAAGARFAEPGEFTRRAFLNGKMDLAQAEAVADVIASTSSAAHRVAMNQLRGGVSEELSRLREELLEMASLLELELDFSEEDVEFANREQLFALVDKTLAHVEGLAASFRQGNLIKNGIPAVIVGPVNAGKSTLLNALLGEERAIVSDMEGTTRDTIEETLNIGGLLFRMIDTAGIRRTSDTVEALGIDRTFRKISQAQLVIAVLDGSAPEDELLSNLKQLCERVDFASQKLILLLNKADKCAENGVNKNVITTNNYVLSLGGKCVVISSAIKEKKGLDALRQAMFEAEKDLVPNENSTFITNTRHLEALTNAAAALRDVRTSLTRNIPTDLVAEDLRRSLSAINTILGTGLLDPDTILHSIFSKHCIGK